MAKPPPPAVRPQSAGIHALAALSLGTVFAGLDVPASVFDGTSWRSLHASPGVIWFEVEHGLVAERERYNARMFAQAHETGRIAIGQHAGFHDVFAPIEIGTLLVVGPFGTARPTSAGVLEHWRWLTKRQGHPADPEFAQYLESTLATLVLPPPERRTFLRTIETLCRLCAGRGDVALTECDALHAELRSVRSVEHMWEAARSLIDPRTTRSWSSSYRQPWVLGIERLPEEALVALAVLRGKAVDPVDELVRRDSFQRESVKLARSLGGTVAGRVGNQGVALLSAIGGSKARRRARLVELADRLALVARGLGFRLHIGLGATPGAALEENYRAALTAAENALSAGLRVVDAATAIKHEQVSLAVLERRLQRSLAEPRPVLEAECERFLDAVALGYSYRAEPIRTYLRAAIERVLADLSLTEAVDEHTLRAVRKALVDVERDAASVTELLAEHRRLLADLGEALRNPRRANRERGLSRALGYIRQHYAEPLTLPEVARVAGFAPNYFSALFKKREKSTFELYVRQLRVERAKILLAQHEIEIQQVAHLSGFRERHYFNRVFRKTVGKTPSAYRSGLAGALVRTRRKRSPAG